MLKVVLYSPQIPQNTGNVARLAAATGCELHLIKPLGFEISDKHLKRAGLDYWPHVELRIHESWEDFLKCNLTNNESQKPHFWFFTTKATTIYTAAKFASEDFLIFGNETSGLPEKIHEAYFDRRILIPIDTTKVRSLNLATSVGIAVYEALRQINN